MNEKKMNQRNSNKFIRTLNILVVTAFIVVAVFMTRVTLFKTAAGENLTAFVENRGVVDGINYATRGNIFDVKGNVIAQTLPSYNMFAILDPNYSKNVKEGKPKLHVVDKVKFADQLAPIIGMPREEMLAVLSKEGFQVEFAPYGNGLTQTKKEEIDRLELEGVYFNSNDSRKYPQGVFASHIVGYASYDSITKKIEGKMGIEAGLDKQLTGTDGMYRYQIDQSGQIIKDAPEVNIPATNGENVYLTLDSYIQRSLEQTVAEVQQKHNPNWAVVVVADPKTGAILGAAQSPTFDPNIKDITSYVNTLVETEYEVGSVMKALTYATAIDVGNFDGEKKIQTGGIVVDGFPINDWNGGRGWGMMPLNDGLCQSSNTAIAHVVENNMTADQQKEYLKRFGFGKATGIELAGEGNGTFALSTKAERITTGFGQGTTATVAQMVQAYSALANKGKMMQLHVVDSVVDSGTGNVTYKHEPKSVGNPVSEGTAEYVTNLMADGISRSDCSSGQRFMMKDAKFAGKTGTAQVADTVNGGYLSSTDANYIYSFAGYAPAENPDFVIYTSISLPQTNSNMATTTMINNLTQNISKHLSLKDSGLGKPQPISGGTIASVEAFPSFINKRKEDIIGYLTEIKAGDKLTVIGDGEYIINQSVIPYQQYLSTQRVIVRTNGANIVAPNFVGWSKKDIEVFSDLSGIPVIFEGVGYGAEQSLAEGQVIGEDNRVITVKLVV
ncbi:MAG: penicillin-binding transpeptidase domain-containing protein [Culicoidibacterales bacterium]